MQNSISGGKKPGLIFVTGIGTDAGKTILSAVLCEALKADYWKPVQAGDLEETDAMHVRNLVANSVTQIFPEAVLLPYPLSPHASAARAGMTIEPDRIIVPSTSNFLVIEGAGGLMVPLSKGFLMIDLIEKLKAEVVLISRHYLGSINHTLLSAEALKSRGISVKGLWFNGDENPESESFILEHTGLPLLGRLPLVDVVDRQYVSRIAEEVTIDLHIDPLNKSTSTLTERDKAVIWHPFTQAKTAADPIGIIKGEGCWLIAEDGKRYLDGTASWWVNAHGHGNRFIAAQLADQARKLEHIIFAGFTHAPAVALAEQLIAMLPGQERIFYSDNGSTSVEVALKISLQYFHNRSEKRTKIIAYRNAYHGDTFGAMSVGARNAFNHPFESLLFEVMFIDPPEPGMGQQSLEQLSRLLDDNEIAAFIFEPLVQGANGMRMHDPEVLSKQIALCRTKHVITIADEVFTGFYRTGRAFASNYLHSHPDIICLSKTITGGTLALGVTAVPAFIYEAFLSNDKLRTFFHGHSFTANPIACRAALASLELLRKPECQENISHIEERHKAFVKEILGNAGISGIRQLGTILAIELKTNEERGYLNPVSEVLTSWFLSRGIYLRPLGNVLYCTPPYVINDDELDLIYNAIREYLNRETVPAAGIS